MEGDLSTFVERARAVVEDAPDLSARTTDLRLTLPILETLGWDVHGPDVVADHVVRDVRSDDDGSELWVDYALLLDDDPVIFVVTAGLGESIDSADGRRLEAAMNAAGVELGIVTNGDTYVFVSGGDDTDRVRCDLSDLPENRSIVANYTRPAVRRRRERRRAERRRSVARILANRRDDVVGGVESALVDAEFPASVAEELSVTGEAVVEGAIGALTHGKHPAEGIVHGVESMRSGSGSAGVGSTADSETGSSPTADDPDSDSAVATATTGDPATKADEARGGTDGSDDGDGPDDDSTKGPRNGRSSEPDDAASEERATEDESETEGKRGDVDADGDEEYVVRFFRNRSSVGAVGHGTWSGALVQAIEYLIAQHALDGSLDLPWGPIEDRAVINHVPFHPDGVDMADTTQLSNGYFVCTTIGVDASRAVIEELAEIAGLRVMFQGDW